MTVGGAMARIAARDPHRTAVITQEGRTSFAELTAAVRHVAAWLYAQGVRHRDRVGVSVTGQFEHLVLSLALLRLGCLQITLASFDPKQTRNALAEQCGVTIVVAEGPDFALTGRRSITADVAEILSDRPATGDGQPEGSTDAARADEVAVLFSSSGTTGHPKLIPLPQRLIVTRSRYTWRKQAPQTVLYSSSIEFNGTKRNLLLGLASGHTMVPAADMGERLDVLCRRHKVDEIWLSHLQAQSLIDETATLGRSRLPSGTRVFLIGSAFDREFREKVQIGLSSNLYVTYGATEYGMISIAAPGQHGAGNVVGRPSDDVTVEIVDPSGDPVSPGERGEIRVRGTGMTHGYFEAPELSARAFRDGWFYTGDCGRFSPDGLLSVEGRIDDMMNMNSIKIFPLEIETAIAKFPGVVECAAFSLRSTVHGDIPVAAVRVASGTNIAELQSHCRSELGVRAPRKLFEVAELPRNAAGKISRSKLAETLVPRSDEPMDDVSIADPLVVATGPPQ